MGEVVRASRRFMMRTGREAFAAIKRGDQRRLYSFYDNLPDSLWLPLTACIKMAALESGSRLKELIVVGRNLLSELDEYEKTLGV